MGLLTFLCRCVGVGTGFVLPAAAGLYAASVGSVRKANYFLRALVIWLLIDFMVAPIMSVVLGMLSATLWPVLYCVLSVSLVVPRFRVLEELDKCILAAANCGHLDVVKVHVKGVLVPLRQQMEKYVEPLFATDQGENKAG
ncbi:hypothetical protein BgAZ_101550 [Babesia gibsoni]|uniref:Uncharacterized protein n=1 Tax=Babesia gibsoni TaxID=33632 RepID=A0AAD8PFA8_BABGI|nr:hypothetical protein BgAZ_101550 [Babesia gibsoni]